MISYRNPYGEIVNVSIDEAINHFKYGISHDIFSQPVISYAELAIMALEKYKEQLADQH